MIAALTSNLIFIIYFCYLFFKFALLTKYKRFINWLKHCLNAYKKVNVSTKGIKHNKNIAKDIDNINLLYSIPLQQSINDLVPELNIEENTNKSTN